MEKVEQVADALKQATLGGDSKGAKKPKKEPKKDKKPAVDAGSDSGPLEMDPAPSFLHDRLELFDKIKKRYDEELAKKPRDQILITMPDGSTKVGTSWETTPGEIARGVSNSLYKRTVVARLDGDPEQLWDLERPLERSCKLELLTFEDKQGQFVFWHSSAHILGEACERRFGCSASFAVVGAGGSKQVLIQDVRCQVFALVHPLKMDSTTRCASPTDAPCSLRIGSPWRRLSTKPSRSARSLSVWS